ncbi:MAG: hypothetical protein QG646_4300 [Euryarchaeota archaeon]|nr:hypothetical protein [Euryarchaeota archaeon]
MSENEERKEEFTFKPFQRNRYYYGKLMTVEDFELEQNYFNDKRHLLNKFTYGKGLLCGFHGLELKPGSSDKVSVRFEDGGVALDFMGREIVVPKGEEKTVLTEKKLPFKKSEFKSTTYLYLRYHNSFSEFVSAASNPLSCDEITCPNRILEDFEVIASSEYPVDEEKCDPLSCTAFTETDDKVFFAAVKEDLSIDENRNSIKHYLQTRRQETNTSRSATGVVYFKQPTENSVTSRCIDTELGKGPVFIQLGLENEKNSQGQIHTGYFGDGKNDDPEFQAKSILDPSSGKFKIKVIFADESKRTSLKIRWWALRADISYDKPEEVKSDVYLKKYEFVDDSEVKARIVKNGLCASGAKNCMTYGNISGGDHYAKVGDDVALNGNPKKLAELKENNKTDVYDKWGIGDWILEVVNYNRLKQPIAEIILKFKDEKVDSFNVSKGDLITYCEKEIEGETGVPLFVTYVDDIYIPIISSLIGREAKVVLKYTWAVSKNVRPQA